MPEEETVEVEEVAPKKGPSVLIVAIAAALLAVVLSVGAMLVILPRVVGGKGEEAKVRGEEKVVELPEEVMVSLEEQATYYVSLGDFQVNLKDDYFLKTEVSLKLLDYSRLHELEEKYKSEGKSRKAELPPEYRYTLAAGGGEGGGEEEETEPPVVLIVRKKMPEIRDLVIDVFNETTSDELLSAEGKEKVREKLRKDIDEMIRDDMGKVLEVLFSEFVLAPAA